ncbi:MAG: protein translocase subunit SecD [Mycobacterium sp.]
MASSSTPVHPYRYLTLFLVLLIGAFLLVFFTGDKQPNPKLGIDLQGGTRVTLTARTPDGTPPTPEALAQAQQIITARVDGLGVSGSEVIVDGDNLVITVPGNDGSEARNLGQTARLFIRPVGGPAQPATPEVNAAVILAAGYGASPQDLPPDWPVDVITATLPPAPPPAAPAAPAADQEPPAEDPAPSSAGVPVPQPRPYPQEPAPTPTPTPTSSPVATTGDTPAPTSTAAPVPGSAEAQAQDIAREKAMRQSADPQLLTLVAEIQGTRCDQPDILAGNDDPTLPLVTCSDDGSEVYILAPSIISGDQIEDASSGLDQQTGAYTVQLQFKGDATTTWADFTAANVGTQTAFTLDSKVVSAPAINESIPGGQTQITGGNPPFTAETAEQLANVLKYGSLPLSFEPSEAETVSATLGLTSLRAGLIGGAVGLALVLLYSLLYYRVLGLLTALSLVASGAMVFAILVLLGRYINYTLDLAGIAGLIIGIGTTADSFVVFFERIKDEIREGRSFRSAVPRGWVRARKTILSGNAVSFLAAAVLYFLAVGQVKGFAFTLGLTTVLDVLVVVLVTWPLVYLASKSTLMAKPALNGLGAVQQIARERRAAHVTDRG